VVGTDFFVEYANGTMNVDPFEGLVKVAPGRSLRAPQGRADDQRAQRRQFRPLPPQQATLDLLVASSKDTDPGALSGVTWGRGPPWCLDIGMSRERRSWFGCWVDAWRGYRVNAPKGSRRTAADSRVVQRNCAGHKRWQFEPPRPSVLRRCNVHAVRPSNNCCSNRDSPTCRAWYAAVRWRTLMFSGPVKL